MITIDATGKIGTAFVLADAGKRNDVTVIYYSPYYNFLFPNKCLSSIKNESLRSIYFVFFILYSW